MLSSIGNLIQRKIEDFTLRREAKKYVQAFFKLRTDQSIKETIEPLVDEFDVEPHQEDEEARQICTKFEEKYPNFKQDQ